MTGPLEDAEIEALLENRGADAVRSGHVRPRDFARPKRFPEERFEELAAAIRRALPDLCARLDSASRPGHRTTLAALVEENSAVLVARASFVVPAIAFDCGNELAFVLWDGAAAVGACEIALGAGESAPREERRLTGVEEALLLDIVKPLAACVASALGMETKNARVARDVDSFPKLDANGADPTRLGVQIAIEGPTGPSTLRVYLPVTKLEAQSAAPRAKPAARPASPPPHISAVSIEVAAEIGAVEVPLRDVLALEIGDVLALTTPAQGLATIVADGRAIATARFGESEGKLAVRIQGPVRAATAAARDPK